MSIQPVCIGVYKHITKVYWQWVVVSGGLSANCSLSDAIYISNNTVPWAAQCNMWLLIKLMLKRVAFSFL